MSQLNFPCNKCGQCCKHIDRIPQLSDFDNGDGVCIHLENNLCSIYEHRPEICNVKVMYEKYYTQFYSQEEFYRANIIICEKLQRKDNK